MDQFSLTQLNKKPSEVLDKAHRHPVALTERGVSKFVLMAADHYERVVRADPRRAYYLPDAPEDVKAEILAALDADDEQEQ
jgi:prevent-host-death family protein